MDFIAKFIPAYDQQSKDHGAKEWLIYVDCSFI